MEAVAQDRIVLEGQDVFISREDIPIKDLKLDPENPRLHYIVNSVLAGKASDEKIHELLWKRDSVKELAKSIHQNGGLIQPLVVRRDGRVIEGNCRTVCLRELGKMYPSDTRWRKAPAQVLPDVSDEQIEVLLVELHVAGKIPWDAYEQARMIWDLNRNRGKPYDWLAAHVRMPRNKLAQLLLAYELTDEYLRVHPDPANVKKYSFFAEAVKKKVIKERLQRDGKFKETFFGWISDAKLTEAKQVRHLPDVLTHEAAVNALDRKGFDAGYEVLVKEKPSMSSDLFASIEETTDRLRLAPFDEIQDLKAGNVQKIVMLRNLYRAIQDIATVAGVQL